jgi:hypothetical protein
VSAGRERLEKARGGPSGARSPVRESSATFETLSGAPVAVSGLPFVVLFTGSRHWGQPRPIWTALDAIAASHPGRRLIVRHGDCPEGADQLAAAWTRRAQTHGWDVDEDPQSADWDHCGPDCPSVRHRRPRKPGDTLHPGQLADYCPNAGPRRNRRMVDAGADICLAAPLGASYGTRGCMRLARSAGIAVQLVEGAKR